MKYLTTLPVLLTVAACADSGANYQPILDGTPTAAYRADLATCQSLARNQNQFDQEALKATVTGAGVGAAIGELDDDNALGGAVAGALAVGSARAVNAGERREAIVVACLRGRGHRVVG